MNERKFNGEGTINGMEESEYYTKDKKPTIHIHYFSVKKKSSKGIRTNFILMDLDKTGGVSSSILKERLREDGGYDLRTLSYNCTSLYGGINDGESIDILSELGVESKDDVTE